MATPTLTASLDKSTYAPGETMTLTVTYGDSDNTAGTVTVVVTDAAGNASEPAKVEFRIADPTTITVTSTPAREWRERSNAAGVAVFTATA